MDGMRFGVGLAAGLLLGLVVIVASVGSGNFALYGTLGSSVQGPVTTATTAIQSMVTQTSTTGQPPYSTNSGNSTLPPPAVATTTQGSISFGNSSAKSLNSVLSSLSSNVNNIPRQPFLSNAIVFVPICVAFLLGAVLYRVSRPSDEEEG
jgi:predicted lipid-binding transport protein (Tim44 family)